MKATYLEFFMDTNDPVAQSFSSQTSNFNFFQLQKLLCCSKKLFDDIQTIHKTVKATEYQMFLDLKVKNFIFIKKSYQKP